MDKKNDPIHAYIVVTHIAFVVATPLLLFIWGGTWLTSKLGLPSWADIIVILLGVTVMLCSLISYLVKLIAMYDGFETPKKHKALKHSESERKENDFYYD